MDIYRTHELHLRLSKEVENLEKEFDADQQDALRELQQAQDEIENKSREDRLLLEKGLGSIPPDFGQFIEEKRDFYLRQATQKYEERLENGRKRFIEKVAAVNEKWRSLPFNMEDTPTPPARLSNGTRSPGMLMAKPSFTQYHPPPAQLAPKAQPAMMPPISNPSNLLPRPPRALPTQLGRKSAPASYAPKRTISETQSPGKIVATEQQLEKRPSTRRSMTFDEVYQNGDAKYKHFIVEYPPESEEFYILKCDDHGVHFGANPLAGAAKHLASRMHNNQSKNYSVAIDALGFRVIGCTSELARLNNTAVESASHNGYKPVNLLQLSVGKRARFVEANPEFAFWDPTPIPPLTSPAVETPVPVMAPPPLRETASPAMAPPPLRDISTPSPAKDRRRSLHARTPSDRSTRSAVLIPDPKPGSLYKGFWKDKRHYPVMVLPVEEANLSSVGLKKTLEDTKLLKDVPPCYEFGKTAEGKFKLERWAPGYEDGGPMVKQRQVPVMYFDRDMSFGWLCIRDLSPFDFDDPDWRQIPFFQKAVEHWESLNKVDTTAPARGENASSAQQPRLIPIPASLSEPALSLATTTAAAAPTTPTVPTTSTPPTASTPPTIPTAPTESPAMASTAMVSIAIAPTAALSRPKSVSVAAPEPTQKPVTPAVATEPKAAPSEPQPVSTAVSKPPAAIVASVAAAPKTTTAPTAVSPRSQPVSATGPKPSAAVVASPTAAAASPTATKPAAPNTASVTSQSGPSSIPPAVVRLAEIAKTDPQLRALIEKVGSKEGTKEDEERLTSIVDRIASELSSSGEAVAATVQSLRPSSVKSDAKNPTARVEASGTGASASHLSLKEGKKGQGLGLKSPQSSKPPTPQLAKATIPSAATPSPLVTAGPTPESSTANSRTSSPTEAPTSTTTPINNPAAAAAKPATFVKSENRVTTAPMAVAAKTGQPPNEKFEVTIGKGSWNVETNEPWGDDRTVRLIACSQTKVASTAPGQEYQYCPYKFDIDPMNFANAVVENCPSSPTPNAKTVVTIVLKKEREGSGDRKVVLTFDRFVNPDTNAVESGRVQARRFCRWLRGVNTSIAYSNKSFK